MKNITTLAFDADDTLWINEPNFREAEDRFCNLLNDKLTYEEATKMLFDVEVKNLPFYGYGTKNFMISAIEVLGKLYNPEINSKLINKTLEIGNDLLKKPLHLIDEAINVLEEFRDKYRLLLVTKGDLMEQERKIRKSGLQDYFEHIEIMSNKKCDDYRNLFKKINCKPENFAMVGNSLKSDILPVLELDAYAIHIPFHVTWEHEMHDEEINHPKFISIPSIGKLSEIL